MGEYRRREPEGTVLHGAVREGLVSFLDEAAERGGVPRYVREEFERYLQCGVLAYGFTRVHCPTCRTDSLVAFSCKGRGLCPSCNARRAETTAIHLTESVLPVAPYRQWTLSFPRRVRWRLARDEGLLTWVLGVFVRGLFAYQRRRAKGLGLRGGQPGAITFVQRFGSALQLSPHFHVLVPEGVFARGAQGVRFEGLPPPSQEEVEALLLRVLRRVERRLEGDEEWPDDGHGALQLQAVQARLPLGDGEEDERRRRRAAVHRGYSLHADTHVSEADRRGLAKLCRYGARGALAEERLERREDGRVAYRMKRPAPDGSTHLVLTPVELLRKLAALLPPPRSHLVRFHGVFAPNAKLRPEVVLAPPGPKRRGQEERGAPGAPEGGTKDRCRRPPLKPKVSWAQLLRRSFEVDVLECPSCGGRRKVLAVLTSRSATEPVLTHLGLSASPAKRKGLLGAPRQRRVQLTLAV